MTTPSLSVVKRQWLGYGQQHLFTSRVKGFIAQEDKMDVPQVQSWKEIVELHHAELIQDYPEHLHTDPAESTPDEDVI